MTTTTPVCPEHGAAEMFQDEFGTFWCQACGRGFGNDDGTTTTPAAERREGEGARMSLEGALIDAEQYRPDAADVFDYYTQVYGVEPSQIYLHDYAMDSHCGLESKKIIDKGKELLDMCDPHPDVVDNIRRGITAAIEVICLG